MSDGPAYRADVAADVDSVGDALTQMYGIQEDTVAAVKARTDDEDSVYHAADPENTDAEQYWVEPDAGLVTVRHEDGTVDEYFIAAADDGRMAVSDGENCWGVEEGQDGEQYVDGESTLGDPTALDTDLAADMYDIATAWDEYQQDQATETAALNIEGNDGHSEVYEKVQDQLEQDGEIVFDGTWSQAHSGNEGARGGAIGVQTKQMLERKAQAGEVPYTVEGDSSGKHFTLRIKDFEEYDEL